ncbi:MAG: hypothetical protein ACO1SV_14340 [Fimbriimonas sp.]
MTTKRAHSTFGLATLAVAALFVVAGCSGNENPPGYEKDDFKKSGPPPEYRGPGQPGGPPSGPPSGPPGGPPTGSTTS